MTTYHFLIGKGAFKIKASFKGNSMVEAHAKLVHFFNTCQILDVYAGHAAPVTADPFIGGKTSFPELKGKPLFTQPKRSNPFADSPVLIVEEEAEMQPTAVEVVTQK